MRAQWSLPGSLCTQPAVEVHSRCPWHQLTWVSNKPDCQIHFSAGQVSCLSYKDELNGVF